jgi:hypothetical protein
MIDPPPPLGGGTEPRDTAVPVIGRPLLGRLFSGTARRGASPELAVAPDDREPESEPPREPPPSRDTARPPVLDPLPLLRVRPCACSLDRSMSFDRRGASKLLHVEGVGELPPNGTPELDAPVEPPPPLELEPPPSPPRGAALPPPPLSPRDTEEPVVLPFDVRSCAVATPAAAVTAAAAVSAVKNLFFISSSDAVRTCR